MKILRAATVVISLLCLLPVLAAGANTIEFPVAAKSGHNQLALSAAFDGTNYLVGFEDSVNCPGAKCISAVKVGLVNGTTGALIGTPITVTSEAAIPSVAFGGGTYLAVWKGTADTGYAIYGQRISTSAALTGPPIIISPSVAKIGGQHDIIQVLFDGINFFVAWEDRTDAASEGTGKIYGWFVRPSGELLGAMISVSDPAAQYGQVLPAMATGGTNIFVVWVDGRLQRACYPNIAGTCYPSDIYGQLITKSDTNTAGALTGSNISIIAPLKPKPLPRDRLPSVASSGANYFVVSQERDVFPDEECPLWGCGWDVNGKFVSLSGVPDPNQSYGFGYNDNNFASVTWDGASYFISYAAKVKNSKTFIEGNLLDPDGLWWYYFNVTAQGGGSTAPWAAVALPQGTGKPFFVLINRGKPGKTWNDINTYSGGKVYGTFFADLKQMSVTDPPPPALAGGKFAVTDRVDNIASWASAASVTTYYFSTINTMTDAAIALTGQRKVPSIPAGGTNTGTISVAIPTSMPAGTYYLIACADRGAWGAWVPDTDFSNNCKASTGTITISKPDMTESILSNEDLFVPISSSSSPLHSINISDTVTNGGDLKSTGTTTRYYLSPSTTRDDPGAVLLTGTRSVPPLAPKALNGPKKTTVKINLKAPGLTMADYNLLACANDTDKTGKNGPVNCKVSSTPAASISCSGCHP